MTRLPSQSNAPKKQQKLLLVLLPIAFFSALIPIFIFGLQNDSTTLPSALINKPAPIIALADLTTGQPQLINQQLMSKIWVMNIWASWCIPCKDEHQQLIALHQQRPHIPIIGINYKDQRENALAWLEKLSNPYTISLSDSEGRTGIDYGVYGVPETFIIDTAGNIRYKHIGPITVSDLSSTIIPIIDSIGNP